MSRSSPQLVRVSSGSAVALGLVDGRLLVKPETLYLLTHHPDGCLANCAFCPQARSHQGKSDHLSRVTWPTFSYQEVLAAIQHSPPNDAKRVCVQTLNQTQILGSVLSTVEDIHALSKLPISVSTQPMTEKQIGQLADAGVDRIGIPLDGATEEVFDRVKGRVVHGPYTWTNHIRGLETAIEVLGKGRVTTHLIVGLGESDCELLETAQRVFDMGVQPALFAFTPVPGTQLERRAQPSLQRYRRIQLATYLVTSQEVRFEEMTFDSSGRLVGLGAPREDLDRVLSSGEPFRTSGCPNCNRPFYNERPSGPLYNYPRPLTADEIHEVEKQIPL